jgi:opacity protein-like surface antigen
MKHLVIASLVTLVVSVGTVEAQTPQAPAAPASLGGKYVEVTFGPTFGHTASGSAGAEAGYYFEDFGFGVFAEGGRMINVATSQIAAKAKTIADGIGATFTTKQPATYFDAGVVRRFSPRYHVTPYALLGIGAANVSNKVSFAVAGGSVTGQLPQLGVQLGADLAGSYTKVFVTLGGGAHMTLKGRWMADLSYRFGLIGKDNVSEYNSISTNRLQFGVGMTF